MPHDYLVWKYQPVPGACILQDLDGFEDTFRLAQGEPLAATFPADVRFHMNPDFPNDLLLADNLENTDLCLVVSAKLREALEKRKLSHVEYLPVSIINHRGRVASKDYSIVHPLNPVDCIDRDKSVFKESRIIPGRIDRFKKLVVNKARIPEDRTLFHMKDFSDIAVVRNDLAKALDAERFRGLGWQPLAQYPR
jgi:uncharacterized protein DUF1629